MKLITIIDSCHVNLRANLRGQLFKDFIAQEIDPLSFHLTKPNLRFLFYFILFLRAVNQPLIGFNRKGSHVKSSRSL